jgi:hypothetical protein
MNRRKWKAVDGSYLYPRYGSGGNREAVGALQSVQQNMAELEPYHVELDAVTGLETDAPWTSLRTWFRAANVKWPEWVTWYPNEQEA